MLLNILIDYYVLKRVIWRTLPIQEKLDPEVNEDSVFNFQIVVVERRIDDLESRRVFWKKNCGHSNKCHLVTGHCATQQVGDVVM